MNMGLVSWGSREGSRFVWQGAKEDHVELLPELNLLKYMFISLDLSRLASDKSSKFEARKRTRE